MKVVATRREAIETTGEVFSDGTALELIRLSSEADETSLLQWDGKSATIGQKFEVDGKIYRAPRLNSTSLRALRLPGRPAPYGSTRDLFDGLRKVLAEYTDLAESYVWQLAYFISAAWLADRLLVAPLLCIIAPLGVAKPQLLRLLSILCRRPLTLAEVTPAAISSLAHLKPTFFFDEPNMSLRAGQFLYMSNNYRDFALGNGRMTNALSAKVICSQLPLGDTLLASQALEIILSPTGRRVPFLEVDDCEKIADEFQSKLLQYRLTNLGKIRTPELDVSELPVPMQDVARALGACVIDDHELQLGVVQLLRERGDDAHFDSSTELGSTILEGLLFCCHSDGRLQVLSGELADIVNTIWEQRHEGRKTTPESVGWKLRAFGPSHGAAWRCREGPPAYRSRSRKDPQLGERI